MATRTVTNTLTRPGGEVAKRQQVSIRLNVAGFTGSGTAEVLDTRYVKTDDNGLWSATLDVNADIDPAGTYYTVAEAKGVVWAFVVPAGSGAISLRDCLVDAPPNTDPVTVGEYAALDARVTTAQGDSLVNALIFGGN